MNTVYCNKKSTHQSASFQFPYFITFGQESLPHQCNQGNRRIHSLTGVMFYPVVQHESWLCKWLNSNAELLTCSEINYQKQSACSHVSRGAGVTSISHSHSTTANSTAWTTYSLLHTNCPGVMRSRFWILKKTKKQTTTTKTWKSFFYNHLTSVTQDAFAVCAGPVCGPAASFHLSAAGSLQHQDLWRQEILQHDSDEHHQHGLKTAIYIPYSFFKKMFLYTFLYLICLRLKHL